MNDYVAHLKQNSVGVGHVIQLGLNRGNLHTLGAPTLQILADRCPTQVSNVETVQLQGANSAHLLKSKNLAEKLKNLNLEERKALNVPEQLRNSANATPIRDLRYDCYENRDNRLLSENLANNAGDVRNSAIPGGIKDVQGFPGRNLFPNNLHDDLPAEQNVYPRNNDYLNVFADTNTNYIDADKLGEFSSKNPNNFPHYAPSQFNRFSETRSPEKIGNVRDFIADTNTNYIEPLNAEQTRELASKDPSYLPDYAPNQLNRFAESRSPEKVGRVRDFVADMNTNYAEQKREFNTANARNLPNYAPNDFSRFSESRDPEKIESVRDVSAEINTNRTEPFSSELAQEFPVQDANNLPHYAPSKFNRFAETRNPQKFGNIRDLAFSTYDPSQVSDQTLENNFAPPNDNLPHARHSNALPGQRLANVVSKHTPYSKIYSNNPSTNIPEQPNDIPEGFRRHDRTNLPYSDSYSNNQPTNIPETNQTKIPRNFPQNYIPSNFNIPENVQNPSRVNVGAISDIAYPTAEVKSAVQRDNEIFQPYTPTKVPNQNLSLACHRCKKHFEEDAIVIGIERSDALFHAHCFKCAGCNQNLADLFYFYDEETGDIYCGRDYAKIRGVPRCKACDELIFVKEYCLAENSTFHVKHFCCFECDTPLAGQDYVVEDDQPICLPCFEKVKADKCSSCLNVIKPDETGANLNGVHFHATDACFACKICKKPLLGCKLLFKNQRLYCSGVCYGVDK